MISSVNKKIMILLFVIVWKKLIINLIAINIHASVARLGDNDRKSVTKDTRRISCERGGITRFRMMGVKWAKPHRMGVRPAARFAPSRGITRRWGSFRQHSFHWNFNSSLFQAHGTVRPGLTPPIATDLTNSWLAGHMQPFLQNVHSVLNS